MTKVRAYSRLRGNDGRTGMTGDGVGGSGGPAAKGPTKTPSRPGGRSHRNLTQTNRGAPSPWERRPRREGPNQPPLATRRPLPPKSHPNNPRFCAYTAFNCSLTSRLVSMLTPKCSATSFQSAIAAATSRITSWACAQPEKFATSASF